MDGSGAASADDAETRKTPNPKSARRKYSLKGSPGAAAAAAEVAEAAGATPDELAYHLYADMLHDHGPTDSNLFAQIAGDRGSFRDANILEINVLNYFRNKEQIRKSAVLRFTTTETTAIFQGTKKHATLFFATSNNTIGIVQDNGSKIFNQLGAKNLITFGSILDQAGKPISPADDPVYYSGTDDSFTIPAAEYGFAAAALSNVVISNFRGGATVCCQFQYSNRSREDAIARKGVVDGTPLKPKPINATDIERAGYFTSIVKIESLEGAENPETLKKYYMGKALGDTMLVASISQSVGVIDNPYLRRPLLKFNTDTLAGFSLTHHVLKTTDQLNHARAIIKGIPSILQVMSKDGKEGYYEFFPGADIDESIFVNHYTIQINELAEKAAAKYDALITSFEESLGDNDVFKPEYSLFNKQLINPPPDPLRSPQKSRVVPPDINAQKVAAGVLIRRVINGLNTLKGRVVQYFTNAATLPAASSSSSSSSSASLLQDISKKYTKLLDQFNCLTPQQTTIRNSKGETSWDIIVIKTHQAYTPEIDGIYRIQLYNTLKAIGEGKAAVPLSFLEGLEPQAGGAELERNHEYYDLIYESLLSENLQKDKTISFTNDEPDPEGKDNYILFNKFKLFASNNDEVVCSYILNAHSRIDTPYVFDKELLEVLYIEMLEYLLNVYGSKDHGTIIATREVRRIIETNVPFFVSESTVLFNAFTFHLNAESAKLYGFVTDESINRLAPIVSENELSNDYKTISDILMEAIPKPAAAAEAEAARNGMAAAGSGSGAGAGAMPATPPRGVIGFSMETPPQRRDVQVTGSPPPTMQGVNPLSTESSNSEGKTGEAAYPAEAMQIARERRLSGTAAAAAAAHDASAVSADPSARRSRLGSTSLRFEGGRRSRYGRSPPPPRKNKTKSKQSKKSKGRKTRSRR